MKATHLVSLAICALGTVASAQTPTYIWTPRNAETLLGGLNNGVLLWSTSGTFQQIHDPENAGPMMTMKGIAFRSYRAGTFKGRSLDLRLTLSHTSVTAQTATRNFATNLGTTNTTIVFGSATTWPTFSFKDFTSTGPIPLPGFTVPFSSPYLYVPQLGSLCWEWRHKNSTNIKPIPLDAATGDGQWGTIGAPTGTGCVATGNTLPATATVTTPNVTGVGYYYRLELTNATALATMALAIGATKNSQNIGWCSNLELNPLAFVTGQTDAQGSWHLQLHLDSLVSLVRAPTVDIHTQFAFSDAGLPAGIGLSNLASYKTPETLSSHGVSLIYNSSSELATANGGINRYGLVIGWLQ